MRPEMTSYGERRPLALDELSDAEDVELGEAPPLAPDPPPGPRGGRGSAADRAAAVDDWADPATFGTTLGNGAAPPLRPEPEVPATAPLSNRPSSPVHRTPTVHDRIESIKAWGISTYKCSRQMIAERLGKSSRTVDAELDTQITAVRETQTQYRNVMRVAKNLSSHLCSMLTSQLQLGELFSQLGQRSPELRDEFVHNANAQKALHESGRPLRDALDFFVSSIETLCDQTIEDTLTTVKQYESARVEFDAYRADLEWARQQEGQPGGGGAPLAEAQRQHDQREAEYHRLREKVAVKLRLLDENRVKVMQNQLVLFHMAVSNYFSGNALALKTTLEHLRAGGLGAGDAGSAGRPGTA